MLMRECALDLAGKKLQEARNAVLAEKARLAEKPGLLKSIAGRGGVEREVSLQTVASQQAHYDSQLKKAESVTALLRKETERWLECCLKTGSPDYAAGLAQHDFPEDWGRFCYNFDLLLKSFQMGLQDLTVQFKRGSPGGEALAQLRVDSVNKLVPVARLIEIDVEFFNRILTQQARQKKTGTGRPSLQPEYCWCETTGQLASMSVPEAAATLRELLSACSGFLANFSTLLKREKAQADARAPQMLHAHPSYLRVWWDNAKPAAALLLQEDRLESVITETQSLLLDGEFSTRFNRYLIKTITPSAPPAAPEKTTAAAAHSGTTAPYTDAELRALKAKLQSELAEVARIKAGLTIREQTLKENEQKFAEKCRREQAALEEAKARLAEQEEALALRTRQAEEKHVEEMAKLEELKGELAARAAFIDESELRLMEKGQQQIEALAELEQKEEELMATKRELNTLRKEMGLPLIPLRTKPIDEFNE